MWLRDFLPQFVPTARILIYGYDSRLEGSTSLASIFEFARKFLETVKSIRGPMVSRITMGKVLHFKPSHSI